MSFQGSQKWQGHEHFQCQKEKNFTHYLVAACCLLVDVSNSRWSMAPSLGGDSSQKEERVNRSTCVMVVLVAPFCSTWAFETLVRLFRNFWGHAAR